MDPSFNKRVSKPIDSIRILSLTLVISRFDGRLKDWNEYLKLPQVWEGNGELLKSRRDSLLSTELKLDRSDLFIAPLASDKSRCPRR